MQKFNISQLVQMMNSGGNPKALFEQMMNSNPNFKNVMSILGKKNPQEMREYAQNLAKERGVNIEDVAKSLGINLPNDNNKG